MRRVHCSKRMSSSSVRAPAGRLTLASPSIATWQTLTYRDRGLHLPRFMPAAFFRGGAAIFYGFWGGCYNDYRNVAPHEGYSIIKSWVEKKFKYTEAATALRAAQNESGADCAGAFFAYTSNVDAHWLSAGFQPHEVHEIHGNCEQWQCAEQCTPQRWAAPPEHRFHVDETSRLAEEDVAPQVPPRGGASASQMADKPPAEKVPSAMDGSGADGADGLRERLSSRATGRRVSPAAAGETGRFLMFNDHKYQTDHKSEETWEGWREALTRLAMQQQATTGTKKVINKVAILEIGCGGNVTTVRMQSEGLLEELLNSDIDATLIRVNPELPFADGTHLEDRVLPILSTGLRAVKVLDELMKGACCRRSRRVVC